MGTMPLSTREAVTVTVRRRPCFRVPRRNKATRSHPRLPTTRSRSRSRTARSTLTARSSTRTRARVLRRRGSRWSDRQLHSEQRRVADPQPRVLRQLHHGERQHLAETDGRGTPLPAAPSERLRLAHARAQVQRPDGCRSGRSATKAVSCAAPVNINATPPDPSVADASKAVLLMGNAERADLIVDFGAVPPGTPVMLLNVGPDAPFGGFPIPPTDVADPATTGQVMRFDVVPAVSADLTTPPQFLKLPAIAPLPAAIRTRKLAARRAHLARVRGCPCRDPTWHGGRQWRLSGPQVDGCRHGESCCR